VQTVPEAAAAAACWSCSGRIDSQDKFCRHCGNGQGENLPWYYKTWGLIFLALFGLGPFVLPMVWRSPALDRGRKLILSAAVCAFTVYVCWRMYTLTQDLNAALSGSLAGLKI
jgi:hypothetical protein